MAPTEEDSENLMGHLKILTSYAPYAFRVRVVWKIPAAIWTRVRVIKLNRNVMMFHGPWSAFDCGGLFTLDAQWQTSLTGIRCAGRVNAVAWINDVNVMLKTLASGRAAGGGVATKRWEPGNWSRRLVYLSVSAGPFVHVGSSYSGPSGRDYRVRVLVSSAISRQRRCSGPSSQSLSTTVTFRAWCLVMQGSAL